MEIVDLATEIFQERLIDKESTECIKNAFKKLFVLNGGDIDVIDLINKFQSGNMHSQIVSWLGDQNNENLSIDQLIYVFDAEALSSFSKCLGGSKKSAMQALAETMPILINRVSSRVEVFDNVGGLQEMLDQSY